VTELAIGLAGAGYWGSKLARNIHEASNSQLGAACDPDAERLNSVVQRYPGCRATHDLDTFLADPELDAVVFATPASMHAEHVRLALDAGKHVLVEKPLALSTADCDELCAAADESGLTLMVGHTFVFSEPVRFLRSLVQEGALGKLLYAYGKRLNLGMIREDLNALWNFGPHDVSIFLYLLNQLPVRVSAQQFSLLDHHLEDVVFVTLEFADGVVAHIHESWLDPRKIRELTLVGDRQMAVYDDTDVETPIRIYDKGVVRSAAGEEPPPRPFSAEGFGEFKLQVRAGDMHAPRIRGLEPLRVEIEHFVECVVTGARPLTDARHGRDVVAVLEAAEQSARNNGVPVTLADVVVTTT
jgi:predicted dehydrogenase